MTTQPPPRASAPADWTRAVEVRAAVSRQDQIASSLREAIISGQIPPGAQLKQDEIGARFGSSPGPVREALRELESEGLVEHVVNRGVFVAELSEEEAFDVLFPTRLIAETYAFQRVAERLDEALVKTLEDQIDEIRAGVELNDIVMVNDADARFHELVVRASGAPHTIQVWQSVWSRIRLQFSRLTPGHSALSVVIDEHVQLLEALKSGDIDVVEEAVREHIIGTSSYLRKNWPKNPA